MSRPAISPPTARRLIETHMHAAMPARRLSQPDAPGAWTLCAYVAAVPLAVLALWATAAFVMAVTP